MTEDLISNQKETVFSRVNKRLTPEFMTSFFIMFIRASSLVIKFILTLYIARYLGFEELGVYGLVAAACAMAPSTLGMGLMYTLSRKAVTLTREEIVAELRFYFKCTLLIYVVLLALAACFGIISQQLFFVLAAFVIVFLEHLNGDIYTLLLNLSKPLSANLLHFVRSSVWMLAFMGAAFFIPSMRDINTIFMFWIVGSLISLFCFFWIKRSWPVSDEKEERTVKAWFLNEFSEAKIAYITNCSRTISQYLNHFLVTIFLGIELTGVYVFFMQAIAAMTNLLQTGIIQIARPKLVLSYKEQNYQDYGLVYKKCMRDTLIIATIMAFCAMPIMYVLVHYVVDKPLAVEWLPIFGFLLALFVIANISEINKLIFYSQHRDDLMFYMFIVLFPFIIILQVLLIYFFGLWGMVVASFLVTIMGLLIQYKYLKRIFFDKIST